MHSRDSLHIPGEYSTYISDNNKSGEGRRGLNSSLPLTTTMVNSKNFKIQLKVPHFLLVSRTAFNSLVGLQIYLISSLEPVLELESEFTLGEGSKLIVLQGAPPGVYLPPLPPGTLLLRSYLSLPQEKVRRRV